MVVFYESWGAAAPPSERKVDVRARRTLVVSVTSLAAIVATIAVLSSSTKCDPIRLTAFTPLNDRGPIFGIQDRTGEGSSEDTGQVNICASGSALPETLGKTQTQAEQNPKTPAGMTYVGTNEKGHKEYQWDKDGSIMVLIPAGEFWMGSDDGEGSPDEHPKHKVYLDDYYIEKYELTNAQYKKFCDAKGIEYPQVPGWEGMDDYFVKFLDYPALSMDWDQAVAYAAWVGKRLPTEAQWEKAARGPDAFKYPWGSAEPDSGGVYRCNYIPGADTSADAHKYAAPVGSYANGMSPYGLYDMAGNALEWCSDWHDGTYYGRSPERNPAGPDSGTDRICRGGSWRTGAKEVRCANRYYYEPSVRCTCVGIRCVFTP
jgi:formylglycine-generating enzyme required for sulfatase activity